MIYRVASALIAAFVILAGLLVTFAPLFYGAYRAGKSARVADHVCTTMCDHSNYGKL